MHHRLPSVHHLFVIVAVLAVIPVLLACSSSSDSDDRSDDGLRLVWEAWEQIDQSYVSSGSLDADLSVSGAMRRVLGLVDVDPYPFLTEIGRMRGQPPSYVPSELVNLWRAVAKYQAANPDFDTATVAEGAIAGLLEGLGGSSAIFLTAEQYPLAKENLEESQEGTYLGIGASVVSQNGQIVMYPFPNSPATGAGIESGDILLLVAGESILGKGVQEVVAQVAGPEGTKVTLEILRFGETEPLELEVFRGPVDLPSVSSQLIPGGVAYMRISQFRDNTGEQVFSSLEDLNRFDLLALIIDLRANPGGSSETAKETAGQFLPDGAVFGYLEGQDGERTEETISPNENRLNLDDLLIAVLVNENTIGEAETLAGALQDSGRATLFGVPTFGDASAYDFVELSNGAAMYLPVSRWYTPSGNLLSASGLKPDFEVLSEPETGGFGGESQFNRAYEFLDGQLPPFR
ncbi:MAG: S41 family peptidase [Chloroflexi bacterium]|nr:S41 family peptidase [Chloroflexota bacterium]